MPPCGGDWVTIEALILPRLPFLHRHFEARHVYAPGCNRSVVSRLAAVRITFFCTRGSRWQHKAKKRERRKPRVMAIQLLVKEYPAGMGGYEDDSCLTRYSDTSTCDTDNGKPKPEKKQAGRVSEAWTTARWCHSVFTV